jgi:hypothetical protein
MNNFLLMLRLLFAGYQGVNGVFGALRPGKPGVFSIAWPWL